MSGAFPSPEATRAEVDAFEREAFYDREIAPRLAEVAKMLEARGMSIVARVDWLPGKGGSTIALAPDPGPDMRIVVYADRAHGNVDVLIKTLCEDARKYGHASVYLASLGIPTARGGQ